MTRETRIGLIVGLAFIVLFGVVLSELGTPVEVTEAKPERASENFYAFAPVTPGAEPQPQRRELPLTARRRTEPQTPAARRDPQPQRRRQPAPVPGTRQTPQRRTRQPTVRLAPARPAGRVDSREMTVEEFRARYGVRGAAERTGRTRTYVTRRGDNLTAIARKFYRTPSRKAVMKIFNANRNVLQSPDSLGVDVKLVIPN